MNAGIRIGIIGDYDAGFPPHALTNAALDHAANYLRKAVDIEWLPTEGQHKLAGFDALWCAPGSPYKSLAGALESIRFARENRTPFLGTCGGFQHAVIEYARNVMGIEDAAHAEYDPYASNLFVRPLSCSLKGLAMEVRLDAGSMAATSYAREMVEESYYCNFGLNPEYQQQLHEAGLRVTGWDGSGEARIVELPQHPFYVATLFVPQARSTRSAPHPLVLAFVRAAAVNSERQTVQSSAV